MRYIIKNGKIYDGSGVAPFLADVIIENKKIAKVMPKSKMDARADGIPDAICIDASGLAVTPGFIDSHRHCDIAALTDEKFGRLEVAQGLTSVFGGNCGLGIFPYAKQYARDIYNYVEPCLGSAPEDLRVMDYSDYRKQLGSRNLPLHVGCLQGLGALKASVKGYGSGAYTKKEMEMAKRLLKNALDEGVPGLSTGIMYQPECYSSAREMVELLRVAAPYHRTLSCHIRSEGGALNDAVREMIEVCRWAEVPLNISHFKVTGIKNWHKGLSAAIETIEAARAAGQKVTVDFYPYSGGATTLVSLLPPELVRDDMEETFAQFASKDAKVGLRDALTKTYKHWDNLILTIGWERILISSVTKEHNKVLVGKNFREAAESLHMEDPAELMAELLYDEKGKVGIILMSMSQDDVDTIARLPYAALISDSLYVPETQGNPHPRLYGSFPKFIREYVIKRRLLPMETAIRKMTSMTAERFGLTGRGRIKAGYYADLAIFDPEAVADHATYSDPCRLSTGMSYVFVDGRLVEKEDRLLETVGARVRAV